MDELRDAAARALGEAKLPTSPDELPIPGPEHPGPWSISDRGNGHVDLFDANGAYVAHVYLWSLKEVDALAALLDASRKRWACAECSKPECRWQGQCDGESCPACGGHVVAVADGVEPCPRGADKPEPTCTNRHQCWEPCGELGHSAEHAVAVPDPAGLPPRKTKPGTAGVPVPPGPAKRTTDADGGKQ